MQKDENKENVTTPAPKSFKGKNLEEILADLENGVQAIFSSNEYKEYLKTMSKFTNYSINNIMLIHTQYPSATLPAGYEAWKKNFKRQVKCGEQGIKIIAPCPYKVMIEAQRIDPRTKRPVIGNDGKPITDKTVVTKVTFKVATVFDVSQTEGEPLPRLGVSELTGKVENYADFLEVLKRISPFPIVFEPIQSEAKGYCDFATQRIVIKEGGMSELQSIKTALHEIAHATLHNYYQKGIEIPSEPHKDKSSREVEAESVAYIVCQHFGLDTSDYSFLEKL